MRSTIMRFAALAVAGMLALAPAFAAPSPTLAKVKKNGFLRCGVNEGLPGFSVPDTKGEWAGMDVDFCRAIAAAIFNDPKKVRFFPTSAKVRFTALQAGDFDVLSRNTTWTISRDVQIGLEFIGVMYVDGQGFMGRSAPTGHHWSPTSTRSCCRPASAGRSPPTTTSAIAGSNRAWNAKPSRPHRRWGQQRRRNPRCPLQVIKRRSSR